MRINGMVAVLLLVASTALAQDVKAPKDAKPRDNYDLLLQEYLQSARLARPLRSPCFRWRRKRKKY